MAKSLSKIKEQIARLQKEADSIQATVITRIKREIAQHGLTSEHLFSANDSTPALNVGKTPAKRLKTGAAKKSGAAKPAKYADGQGNEWHGIGKRPQWIHAALNAGRALSDFLIGAQREVPAAAAPSAAAKAAPKAARKVSKRAAGGKAAPAKKIPRAKKATKPAAVAKPAAKSAAKAPAKKLPAKKAPAKRAAKPKTKAVNADAAQASA